MRPRTVGKIVSACLTIVCIALCVIWTFKARHWPDEVKHVIRALSFAVLSVTTVTSYRYFED